VLAPSSLLLVPGRFGVPFAVAQALVSGLLLVRES
jgi:hypothetical protein